MKATKANAEYKTISFELRAASGAAPARNERDVAYAVYSQGGVKVGELSISAEDDCALAIELDKAFDSPKYVDELMRIAVPGLVRSCASVGLKCDVGGASERIPILERYGFERIAGSLYARPAARRFDARRGVAYCGLACCVCGEGEGCAGCRNLGCATYASCRAFECCGAHGLAGCGQCADFPCDWDMLCKLRVRAFARYAALRGEEALLAALKRDEERGVIYHYTGKLYGDYDLFADETELMRFLGGE